MKDLHPVTSLSRNHGKNTITQWAAKEFMYAALAGVLPHDGRNITFKEMKRGVTEYYNISPTFAYFVCNSMAKVLKRKYSTDRLDLNDMCVHNGIVSLFPFGRAQ
jgi:hypothetical protein